MANARTSNAKQTIGTLFGAVTSAATAVNTTFETITDGIDIAHASVANAKRKQRFDHLAEAADYEASRIDEIADRQTVRQRELQKKMEADSAYGKLFQDNRSELLKAIYGEEATSE